MKVMVAEETSPSVPVSAKASLCDPNEDFPQDCPRLGTATLGHGWRWWRSAVIRQATQSEGRDQKEQAFPIHPEQKPSLFCHC